MLFGQLRVPGRCAEMPPQRPGRDPADEPRHRASTRPKARAISVRLDDDAEQALRTLEATGLTQSDAIRSALLTSARRLRHRRELAAEVAALEADDTDRAEMLAVAAMMEAVRAAR